MHAREYLYLGTNGHVAAIDPATGVEVWRVKLESHALVTLLVRGNMVFAGCRGILYGLHGQTGRVLWKNDLPRMSYGHICLAMEGVADNGLTARVAAEEEEQAQQPSSG